MNALHRVNVTRSAPDALQVVRFASDMEVQRGGDGRTIHGIIVPWNQPTRVYDRFGPTGRLAEYLEAVDRGAFPEAVANPRAVKLLGHHNASVNPLGRGLQFRDDAAGQYGEFRVSKTVAGDEVLELARDGALDAFSVGFVPVDSVERDGVFVRTHGRLNETSVVTFAAYPGALVGGVRGQDLPSTEANDLGPGAGESLVESGSGDPHGSEAKWTGMTHAERIRVLELLALEG